MADISVLQRLVNDHFSAQLTDSFEPPHRKITGGGPGQNIEIPFWNHGMPVAPAVVDQDTIEHIAAASSDLVAGMDILLQIPAPRQYLTDISRFTPEELELCDNSLGTDYLGLARADVIISDGRIGITELNATSRFGYGIEYDLLVRRLEAIPPFAATVAALGLQSPAVFHRIREMIRRVAQAQSSPGVCIAVGHRIAEVAGFFLSDALRAELDASADFPVVVAGLEDLNIENGFMSHPDAGDIGVIYRLFGPWGRSAENPQHRLRQLIRASDEAKVAVLDGFVGECRVTKLPLTLLSDERWLSLLPAGLAERLPQSVLWTRLLQDSRTEYAGRTINLIPFVAMSRHELVLKPGRGTGGRGLVVGAETTQSEWESHLGWAMHARDPWVVQQVMWPDALDILRWDGARGSVTSQIVSYGAVLIDRIFAGLIRRNGSGNQLNLNAVQGISTVPVYVAGKYGLG
jgi:hypothetical protein